MRLAFITYEYPTDLNFGGIATYVRQAAHMLINRGHHVDVFTGTNGETRVYQDGPIKIYATNTKDMMSFSKSLPPTFLAAHERERYDVIEVPEISSQAAELIKVIPNIPILTKLHTPTYMIDTMNWRFTPLKLRLRSQVAALRGRIKPYWRIDPDTDPEALFTRKADFVVGPSLSICELLQKHWNLDPNRLSYTPNPYHPSQVLLQQPYRKRAKVITYYGRLEARKGVMLLPKIYKQLAERISGLKFRFIGADQPNPSRMGTVGQYMRQHLEGIKAEVEFAPRVPPEEIPNVLATSDVCVFPSLWENFPTVCLEAMSSGVAVVGSRHGGMLEMLGEKSERGTLIDPLKTSQTVSTIADILRNDELRIARAEKARAWIIDELGPEKIGARMEDDFVRCIDLAKGRVGVC